MRYWTSPLRKCMGIWDYRPSMNTLVDYLPSPNFSSQLPVDSRQIRAFAVGTTELDDRLDASYHLPITKSAIAVMTSGHFPLLPISEMCADIKLPGRFKRVYVDKEYGIPFIQGSHIPLMKPYNLKYLARRHYRSLDQWKVSPGWVLVTCSGTIGRVSMVPSGEEGFAASQHLIRIIAKRPDYNPGYLALFLMTPYGRHQMLSKIYGAVVDELTASDLAHVMVPDAPSHIQDSIGEKVLKAFETKEQANLIENNAIREFEGRLGKQ